MFSIHLNTSYRLHLFIAIIVSVWLAIFLVLIAPFDAAELSFLIRLQILPPYGIISLLGYLAIIPIQNLLFSKLKRWNILFEGLIIFLFNIVVLFGSFAYYKTSIINGLYSFTKFTFEVYYPIFFILLPIIVFGRWYLTKKSLNKFEGQITLRGENKYDILNINLPELICVSSADNYVEVAYLSNKKLCKKLLRSTLRNVHEQQPDLLRVHRSHIINPIHFKEWKTANSLQLTKMEVPISKNYKKDIKALFDSPLKPANSSQT